METLINRFLDKVEKRGPNDCWLWVSAKTNDGYGEITIDGQLIYAHRFSYELFVGPIPDGLCVCHHCDNPPCCNPKHLFTGSRKDNAQDMVRKGRWSRWKNKFTEEQIKIIRASEKSIKMLAKQYSVNQNTVWKIVTRKTYQDIS